MTEMLEGIPHWQLSFLFLPSALSQAQSQAQLGLA